MQGRLLHFFVYKTWWRKYVGEIKREFLDKYSRFRHIVRPKHSRKTGVYGQILISEVQPIHGPIILAK